MPQPWPILSLCQFFSAVANTDHSCKPCSINNLHRISTPVRPFASGSGVGSKTAKVFQRLHLLNWAFASRNARQCCGRPAGLARPASTGLPSLNVIPQQAGHNAGQVAGIDQLECQVEVIAYHAILVPGASPPGPIFPGDINCIALLSGKNTLRCTPLHECLWLSISVNPVPRYRLFRSSRRWINRLCTAGSKWVAATASTSSGEPDHAGTESGAPLAPHPRGPIDGLKVLATDREGATLG
jgi:hypothetical protein